MDLSIRIRARRRGGPVLAVVHDDGVSVLDFVVFETMNRLHDLAVIDETAAVLVVWRECGLELLFELFDLVVRS